MTLGLVLGKVGLLVASLALSLLLAEGGVRLLERFEMLPGAGGLEVFPEVPYSGKMRLSSNPRLFVELDPSSPLLNSRGFRDREYAVERGDEVRIVVLGDSVTFGRGVPLELVYTEVLEDLLNTDGSDGPRYEVLNFGVGGYNTEQEVELYRVKAGRYAPDLIVVGFVLNDCFAAGTAVRSRPRRGGAAGPRGGARIRPAFAGLMASVSAPRSSGSLAQQSRLLALMSDRLFPDDGGPDTRRVILNTCADPKLWRIVQNGFRRLAVIQRRDQISVLVVIFPMLLDLQDYPFAALHERVSSDAREAGLEVLDLLDVFEGYDEASLRRSPLDSIHPNAKAHRLAAERIHAHLQETHLLKRRVPPRAQAHSP